MLKPYQPLTKLVEKEMSPDDLDLDHVYDLFAQSYIKATGTAFKKEDFMWRAEDWTFYGSDTGMVAVRHQNSGGIKLVGVAGDTPDIVRGLMEVLKKDTPQNPLWGLVSDKLLKMMLASRKFTAPPAWVAKRVLKSVGKHLTGGNSFTIEKDGGLTFFFPAIGKNVTKYFVSTTNYYRWLLVEGPKNQYWKDLPKSVTKAIELMAKGVTKAIDIKNKIKGWFSWGKKGDQPDDLDESFDRPVLCESVISEKNTPYSMESFEFMGDEENPLAQCDESCGECDDCECAERKEGTDCGCDGNEELDEKLGNFGDNQASKFTKDDDKEDKDSEKDKKESSGDWLKGRE